MLARTLATFALALAVLLGAPAAQAQIPGLGGPAQQAPKPPPGTPETHAASGAEQANLPKIETQLPEDPLAIPEVVKDEIGTNREPEDDTQGTALKADIDFYGVWYSETNGDYRFRSVFPFWAERTQPGDRASLFGLYYQQRSTDFDADVVFPFFWHLRDKNTYTTVVGPFAHQESDGEDGGPPTHANWLPPLFFEGKTKDGGGYLHIPPLLTFTEHSDRDGLNVIGPAFCKWKGGPSCDIRTADKIDMGIAPFYFYGRDTGPDGRGGSEYEVIPPLLHYYSYNEATDSETNLWGPLLWQRDRDGEVFDILPLFYRNWGKNYDNITLFPFFHYGYKGNSHLLITPLFVEAESEEGADTFVTWGYARYRGRTELDMITPLFWWYRDPDIGLDTKLLFPFYYQSTSPRVDDLMIFPFYAHFKRPGLSESTWVTPLFNYNTSVTGWSTNIYPIFFAGRKIRGHSPRHPPSIGTSRRPSRGRRSCSAVLPVRRQRQRRSAGVELVLLGAEGRWRQRVGVPFLPGLLLRRVPHGALVEHPLRARRVHAGRHDVQGARALHPHHDQPVAAERDQRCSVVVC
ncbi:MAG: hypothetical protein IPM79_29855 [Polyangiaceae bacterium]|nr:hypothetical protein [Polyangiaceae bacterium]